MTRKKELSIDLVESVRDNVIFDDNSKISVQDKGNVLIKLKHGNHDFILNVYYVPNLHRNLLSLSQLLQKNCNVDMKNHYLTLWDTHHNLITYVKISYGRILFFHFQHDILKCFSSIIHGNS